MKIRECLVRAATRFSDNRAPEPSVDQRRLGGGIPDPILEAEVLMRHILGMERAQFFSALDAALSPDHQLQISQFLTRRLAGEPLAYIVGHREFYGLDLVVNAHVLVPRQETELLVDKVLEFCSDKLDRGPLHVVDVGTGSGAVAIAIASNLPQSVIYATDVRREALAVADVNRRRHGVLDRVHLCQGDLLEFFNRPVDVIVSNPPYIRTQDIARLAPEVRREPSWALDGGADGLEVTRRLLQQAPEYIRPGGLLLFEIAPEGLEPVSQLARQVMPSARVSSAKDLLGLPRVVMVQLEDGAARTQQRVSRPAALSAVVQSRPY